MSAWSKIWKCVVYLRPALRIKCRGDHLLRIVDRSLPRLTGALLRAWLRLRHGAFWGCAPAPLTKLDLIDWLIVQVCMDQVLQNTQNGNPSARSQGRFYEISYIFQCYIRHSYNGLQLDINTAQYFVKLLAENTSILLAVAIYAAKVLNGTYSSISEENLNEGFEQAKMNFSHLKQCSGLSGDLHAANMSNRGRYQEQIWKDWHFVYRFDYIWGKNTILFVV